MILPSFIGIKINHYKDPYETSRVFFRGSHAPYWIIEQPMGWLVTRSPLRWLRLWRALSANSSQSSSWPTPPARAFSQQQKRRFTTVQFVFFLKTSSFPDLPLWGVEAAIHFSGVCWQARCCWPWLALALWFVFWSCLKKNMLFCIRMFCKSCFSL